jgi:hypothetical protein
MDRRSLTLLAAVVVLVTGCGADRSGSAPTAGAAATASSPDAARQLLDVTALPTGAPPRVAYAFAEHPTFGGGDWQLVRPDGSRRPFTDSPGRFVAYDDVVVNGYGTEGGFVVELFDGRGRLRHQQRDLCSFALVTSPDRSEVAWVQNAGGLVEQYSDGSLSTRPARFPGGACGDNVPVALRGPTLYVDSPAGPPRAVTGPRAARPIRGLRDLTDVSSRGELVGRLSGGRRCWGLLGKGHQLGWRTCRDRLRSFAPDGRHVLGTRGTAPVVHGTVDGSVAAEWRIAPHQRVDQAEWEDAQHLLLVVRAAGTGWSVVRLGLDGSAEYAVPPVRTGPEFSPFRLPMS